MLVSLRSLQRPVYSALVRTFSSIPLAAAKSAGRVKFEFSQAALEELDTIVAKYPSDKKESAIIPALHLAQKEAGGWLPLTAMKKVAATLKVDPIAVYEVATFYTMFNKQPVGKFHVQVCTNPSCMCRGSGKILDAVSRRLGITVGETTADNMFTVSEVECQGACANAPMLSLNDDYFEDLTPETAVKIIDDIYANRIPIPGPQNGRNGAEGIEGKTTLREPSCGPHCTTL
eukprot:GCRY01000717.1.p1 GENE.GCRY01000717.1~~GCRY01000717.1.p1  ORF type:complete len:257 (-),score=38.51 GCRY01000717.1:229-921(-)